MEDMDYLNITYANYIYFYLYLYLYLHIRLDPLTEISASFQVPMECLHKLIVR